MVRKPLTISIERKILESFKKYCEDNDIILSKRIERYMKEELKKKRR